MNKYWIYIKEHPWTLAVIVVGVIVVYYFWTGGSSGTTVVSGTATDPNADALTASLANTQAQTYAAGIAGNVQAAQIDAAKIVSLAGIAAQEDVQLSGNQSQVQIAQIAGQDTLAQIAAAVMMGQQQANTYTHIADVSAATTVTLQRLSLAGSIAQDFNTNNKRAQLYLSQNLSTLLGYAA